MIQNDISSAGQDKGNRPRKRLVRTGALKSRRYSGRHESSSGSTLADDSDYKGKYEALPPPDTSSAGEPVYRPYLNEPAGDKLPYEAKYEAEPAMPVYQGKYRLRRGGNIANYSLFGSRNHFFHLSLLCGTSKKSANTHFRH